MKLKTGRTRYKIPAFSRIEQVVVEGNQKHNQMCSILVRQVAIDDINFNADRGLPALFSVWQSASGDKNFIEFYPVPDKPYMVRIRYTPPLQEI